MGTRHDELRQDLDLDQLEGVPTDRSDTIIYTEPERLSAEVILLKGIRLKFVSLTSSRSPAGVALAIMMLAVAATVPTAVIGVILHLVGVPAWFTATGALATLTGITAIGIGPIHQAARQQTEQPMAQTSPRPSSAGPTGPSPPAAPATAADNRPARPGWQQPSLIETPSRRSVTSSTSDAGPSPRRPRWVKRSSHRRGLGGFDPPNKDGRPGEDAKRRAGSPVVRGG